MDFQEERFPCLQDWARRSGLDGESIYPYWLVEMIGALQVKEGAA